MLSILRHARLLLVLLPGALVGCGGGGGGSGNDTGGDDDGGGQKTYVCEGTGSVSVSGKISYEFVPAVSGAATYLDYSNTEQRPVRRAEVQARCPDGSVTYATTTTDNAGNYSLSVPASVDVVIRVRALLALSGTPAWDVRVVDNTSGQAVWSTEGDVIDAGDVSGSLTANLTARSGWGGSSYTSTRAAAPFAILDSVYTAMQRVLEADAAAVFEPLKLNWSAKNTDQCGSSLDKYPFSDGCIGTSFFVNFGPSNGGRNIFILGAEDSDTDEYDRHVVIHEWGHYYEDAFARSDSIGGRHGGADKLDMRVAFGEGWGNAWSGIATDDPLYIDTFGSSQSMGFSIDVENDSTSPPGWWNETSVQRIIYDLYDSLNDDGVELGFAPIHSVLTNEQRNTAATTSIFSLIHFLKENNAGSAGAIDTLVEQNDIATINDPWGDNRDSGFLLADGDDGSEFGFSNESEKYVSPVHIDLRTVSHGTTQEVCSTNELAGTNGSYTEYNRLGSRRFVRFQVDTGTSWRITLDGSSTGIAGSDPDFYVNLNGARIATAIDDSSSSGIETENVALSTGTVYVLEAMEWLNTDNDSSTGGNACMSLSFELI